MCAETNVAACPECGSQHITASNRQALNWGRAIGGWLLFGPVGGAVGSLTGQGKQAVLCMDCGSTWSPADLRQSLTTIERYTGRSLTLEQREDRDYLRDFISCIEPVILEGLEAEKRASDLDRLADAMAKSTIKDEAVDSLARTYASQFYAGLGCALGFFVLLMLLLLGMLSWDALGLGVALVIVVFPLWLAGSVIDALISRTSSKRKKQVRDQKNRLLDSQAAILEKASKHRDMANSIRREAEKRFEASIAEFDHARL
jgi:hypothetical protein